MEVKKGLIVNLKTSVLEPGEEAVPHVALEDSFPDGSFKVQVLESTLTFPPINSWHVDWIEA